MTTVWLHHHIGKEDTNSEEDDNDGNSSCHYIRLLPNEEKALTTIPLPPIVTATWYNTSKEETISNSIHVIQQRLCQIMELNPWLMGQFVKKKKQDGHWYISYNKDDKAIDRIDEFFQVCQDHHDDGRIVRNATDYDPLRQQCNPYVLAMNKELQQPFLKLVLLTASIIPEKTKAMLRYKVRLIPSW